MSIDYLGAKKQKTHEKEQDEKISAGGSGKIPLARLPIVQCTQAEYDALVSGGTVDANTIYCIIPA